MTGMCGNGLKARAIWKNCVACPVLWVGKLQMGLCMEMSCLRFMSSGKSSFSTNSEKMVKCLLLNMLPAGMMPTSKNGFPVWENWLGKLCRIFSHLTRHSNEVTSTQSSFLPQASHGNLAYSANLSTPNSRAQSASLILASSPRKTLPAMMPRWTAGRPPISCRQRATWG